MAYQALDPSCIRVIDILPGHVQDELSCQMRVVDLTKSPKYDALSYVWGGQSDKASLICSGMTIPITRNLAAALQHIRVAIPDTGYHTLWVDAVCINQKDIGEKQTQIPLMGRIYSQASTVIIWLGDADRHTEGAINGIQDLCDKLRPRAKEFMEYKQDNMTISEINDMKGQGKRSTFVRNPDMITRFFDIKPVEDSSYQDLVHLFKRPWFARAWTFQESWLATRRYLQYGHYKIDSNDLLFIMRVLMKLNLVIQDNRFSFPIPYGMLEGREFHKTNPYGTVLSLLVLRRGSGCQMPQDLIYSILGSVQDTMGIKPDYDLSWPKVFADYSLDEIKSSGNLSILGQVQKRTSELPSWVPDWRSNDPPRHPLTSPRSDRRNQIYSCSGSSTPLVKSLANSLDIILSGFEVDKVMFREPKSKDTISWVTECLAVEDKSIYKRTSETINTIINRVRCVDLALYDGQNQGARWGPDAVERINYLADKERGPAYTRYLKDMITKNRGKCLLVTELRFIGSAPDHIQEGDIVCVLLGGEVPVILRHDPSDEKYELIGECYLHGIMDGEALVEERLKSDPLYDGLDKKWLNNLHLESSFLSPREFRIK